MASIWHTIQNIPHRYLFAAMCIFTVVMVWWPQPFALKTSQQILDFYNWVEAIPAGSVVLVDWSSNIQTRTELLVNPNYMYLAHLFKVPDIKILVFSTSTPGPVNWEMMYTRLLPGNLKEQKPYGEGVVYLGYIPGEESAIAAICSDIRGVASSDYYGNLLDNLPMMATGHPDTGGPINDATAYFCVNFMTWNAAFIASFARVFGDAWGVPIVIPGISSWEVNAPYYPMYIKQYFMFQNLVEYEYLTGYPGVNLITYSGRAWWSLIMVILLIVINVAYLIERGQVTPEAVVRE